MLGLLEKVELSGRRSDYNQPAERMTDAVTRVLTIVVWAKLEEVKLGTCVGRLPQPLGAAVTRWLLAAWPNGGRTEHDGLQCECCRAQWQWETCWQLL